MNKSFLGIKYILTLELLFKNPSNCRSLLFKIFFENNHLERMNILIYIILWTSSLKVLFLNGLIILTLFFVDVFRKFNGKKILWQAF